MIQYPVPYLSRYNLYFAYKRSKIDKNMHATAVNCVMASLLIMQLILLFFNIVRASDKVRREFSCLCPFC